MKKFTDEFLNPSDKVNYRPEMTVDDVLHYIHIDKSKYYNFLSVASDVDYEIHLKRPLEATASSTIRIQLFYLLGKLIWISNQFLIIISVFRICVYICQRVEHIVLRQLELLPKRPKRITWI